MADAVDTLRKHIVEMQEETLEFFTSLVHAETMEEKVAEAKLINKTLADKQQCINSALLRIKAVSEKLTQIKQLQEERKEIVKRKEDKIMKLIKSKNELFDNIEKLKGDDVFALRSESNELGKEYTPLPLTRSKIREISNFGRTINYLRTPFARTMVQNLHWNTSILHQNSDRRVEKPEVIQPSGNIDHIREGTTIVLHCNEPKAYIVYTLDNSIPCFTNGMRYDARRGPIIVPEDVLSFSIKFVACKLRMIDSEICVRHYKVSKDAPMNPVSRIQPAYNPSHAIRDTHVVEVSELNLGLETPSSSNMTPQHPSGRLSSLHNLNYIPVSKPGDEDDDLLSDESNPI